ncbi:hypothetical protein AC249_AIPGENE28332 [Exaiptasia diaphana]|nr:hypothetical protein AC249_AIPGENE28332 [Exaiptasia diaphana]
MSHCPICQDNLQEKIKTLGQIARKAIFDPKHKEETTPEPDDEDDESDDTDNTNINIHNFTNAQEMQNTIADLNSTISSLSSLLPPSLPNKHHILSHSSSTTASQQSASQQSASTPSNFPQQPTSTQQSTTTTNSASRVPTSFTVRKNNYPGVTEWLLPKNISKSEISGSGIGSNSCTVISVLCTNDFLSGTLKIPSTLPELVNSITTFAQNIKTGNTMYERINIPSATPKPRTNDLLHKLQDLSNGSDQKRAVVIIVQPDKSMSILMVGGKCAVFDNHRHDMNGGLIAT